MTLTRKQSAVALLILAIIFGLSLYHASWLAPAPSGRPILIADGPVDLLTTPGGCILDPEAGYGATLPAAEIRMLQASIGAGAGAVNIPIDMIEGKPLLHRRFEPKCSADKSRARVALSDAPAALGKAQLFIPVLDSASAKSILQAVPSNVDAIFYGTGRMWAPIGTARPNADRFNIVAARQCVQDYKALGWAGHIPPACTDGWALLTLDDLGMTLWGWPNRYLARMKAAGVRVVIAQDVTDGKIKGLTSANQYGAIANSYNGYIWVDNIAELGPALKR